MSLEPVRVKQEILDCAGACEAQDISNSGNEKYHIKKELKDADLTEPTVQVKEEPWCHLYADYVVKEELELGPECLQEHIDTTVYCTDSGTSAQDRPITRDCSVRLNRLPQEIHRTTKYSQTYSRKPDIQDVSDNDEKLACDVCSVTFSSKSDLMKHLMVHILSLEDSQDEGFEKDKPIFPKFKNNVIVLKNLAHPSTRRVAKKLPSKAKQRTSNATIIVDTFPHTSATSSYVCDTCGKIYLQKQCLIDHFKVHLRGKQLSNHTSKIISLRPKLSTLKIKGELTCETCKKVFTHPCKLKRHALVHTGDKPYSCEICQKKCTTKNNLDSHKRTHTREQPYSCDVCQKKFSQSSSLKIHKRVHTGEKPYSCKVCNKVFTQSGHLTTHERIHTGFKPHACPICKKQFAENNKLVLHKLIHTGGKPLSCEVCGKRFRQTGHLARHKISHTGEKAYFCEICEKRFGDSSQLRHHKRIHSGVKPYKCEICKKQFTGSDNLSKHKRIHTGEKPYACEICGKRCSEAGSLKVHMRTHTGDKPFFCELCPEHFAHSSSLTAHMRYHTRDMLSCGTCSKQFVRSNDLKKHEKIHTGIKPYACDICARRFNEKYTLVRHIRTHVKKGGL